MIKRLTIENYILINHLDTQFPGDLVIITGETGAGKSILLGALSLLLGAKADASVVKDSSRNCVVEAEFETAAEPMIIRRVVSAQGRSRAFVNDEPVTLDALKEMSSNLLDIHSQNQHLLLADRRFQLSVIDGYASLGQETKNYSTLYQQYAASCRELETLESGIARSERDREYLEFQYGKLCAANLVEGELPELEAQQKQLANSEQIRESLEKAVSLFDDGRQPLDSVLKEAESSLSRVAEYVPGLKEICDRISSARIELKDIYEDIEGRRESAASSPQRLEDVESRLALLYDLMRLHGVSSVEELAALRDSIAGKLGGCREDKEKLEELRRSCAELKSRCTMAADALHAKRAAAAGKLSGILQTQIRELEMPRAVFSIKVVKKDSFGPDGASDIIFLFNANGGEMQNLSKCASGGELSRIMLCIKSLVSRFAGMPTVIFDEIDTGVSGSIADRMGRMIVEMGSHQQVFAITHLPQVASKGSAHYLVYKEIGPQGPQSHIKILEGEERTREIARMLSGSTVTPQALANAEVLLKTDKQ